MDTTRRDTRIAGTLILAGMLAGAVSVVPVLEHPDYLARIPAHRGEILLGAAAQLLMVPAVVGAAVHVYPTLRRGDEALSLGFLGFRLVAATCHVIGVLLLPLLLALAGAGRGGAAPAAHIAVVGELLREGRDLVNHGGLIIALCTGDLLLFRILHRWRLVPRWLSAWGFLGSGLALTASAMVLAGLVDVVTPLYLSLNAPVAIQGVVLGVWLMAKGLDTTELERRPARPRAA